MVMVIVLGEVCMTYPKQIYAYRLRAKHTLRGVIAAIICSWIGVGCCVPFFPSPSQPFIGKTFSPSTYTYRNHGYVPLIRLIRSHYHRPQYVDDPVITSARRIQNTLRYWEGRKDIQNQRYANRRLLFPRLIRRTHGQQNLSFQYSSTLWSEIL